LQSPGRITTFGGSHGLGDGMAVDSFGGLLDVFSQCH
jgi:hypothetical protein